MKRILVTGVRAPAALEVIRGLSKSGYEVYAADCLRYPLGRFSSAVKAYAKLPSPRYDFEDYKAQLIDFVQTHEIDMIFPTCEEVFYLSACKPDLEKYCNVFCEGLPLLTKLHDKHSFQTLAQQYGIGAIKTFLIEDQNASLPVLQVQKTYVAKPAFSRFGDKAILDLKPDEVKAHLSADLFPWVVQEQIKGEEFCSYALCRNGSVISQSCYQPYFRAGQGSSVYFKAVTKSEIFRQVETFVAELNYTGQIGFDFIEQPDGQTFVLECNPRGTSGVHLLWDPDWGAVFSDKSSSPSSKPAPLRSKMIALAMLIYGLRAPNKHGFKEFIRSCRDADDVIYSHQDWMPSIAQTLSLLEIFWRTWKSGKTLKDASTQDIEWDGQAIG